MSLFSYIEFHLCAFYRHGCVCEHSLSRDCEHRPLQVDAVQTKYNCFHFICSYMLDVYEASSGWCTSHSLRSDVRERERRHWKIFCVSIIVKWVVDTFLRDI